ncbi:hypothetical protein D3C81_1806410 [compost metagenome]
MDGRHDFAESQHADQIARLHHNQRTDVFFRHRIDRVKHRTIWCHCEENVSFYFKYFGYFHGTVLKSYGCTSDTSNVAQALEKIHHSIFGPDKRMATAGKLVFYAFMPYANKPCIVLPRGLP